MSQKSLLLQEKNKTPTLGFFWPSWRFFLGSFVLIPEARQIRIVCSFFLFWIISFSYLLAVVLQLVPGDGSAASPCPCKLCWANSWIFPSCSSARGKDLTLGSWRVTAKPLLRLPQSPNVTLVKVRDEFLHHHSVSKPSMLQEGVGRLKKNPLKNLGAKTWEITKFTRGIFWFSGL